MPQNRISEDTLFSSVRALGNGIRKGDLSPVALTQAYLERLEKIGPKLGAVVTVTRDLALQEARVAENEIRAGRYRSSLHGIPYGVKDLAATRGIPTTCGAEPYRKQIFNYDATIVRKLREAGAILCAKLAMVELAGGFGYGHADASFTGPGRNPWNTAYWAGGSSSGPGAAMAAALVAFTIGSETSGSIITPCAYSGVSGLRPTYGRVSRHGAMALCWTLDKLGPMCRTAEDCGLVLAAIAGRDHHDPTTLGKRFAFPETNPPKRFRIAVIKDSTQGTQKEVRENFEQALKVLAKFCDIADAVTFPSMPYGPVVSTIVQVEGAAALRELLENGRCSELRAQNDKWGGYAGLTIPAVDYLQAMRIRTKMIKALDELYAKYDALVSPGRSTVAYPADVDFNKAYPGLGGPGPAIIPAGNLAGQPAVCVPNGFGAHNLPTAIQFTGRAWSEARLLSLAHAYQQATDWHTRRPKLM